jgi:hypothetical protein
MNEGQELVEAKTTEMQVFSEFDARIAELKEHLTNKEYNLTTEEGKDEAEKDKGLLRKVEIKIEKKRKIKGADLLKATKGLNADAKVYHNKVHDLWEIIDKPLQIIRQAELDAIMDARDAEQAELKAAEEKREAELLAREVKVNEGLAKLAEQEAELDAARDAAERKEELEAAALLAAEAATLQAAQDAIDAAAKAKQVLADAIAESERKSKVAADALAKKAADLYEAKQAEKDKLAAEHQARVTDLDHRRDYNSIASQAIFIHCGDVEVSEGIVRAIVKGEIPNVTLNY